MITVIRIASLGLFYYREKPVTGGLGQSGQNHRFIAVIATRNWFSLSPGSDKIELQTEYGRFFTDLHTTRIIQIPIVLQHTASPCLRPAVSSFGACPTPAP
jgi:hypothetical protein